MKLVEIAHVPAIEEDGRYEFGHLLLLAVFVLDLLLVGHDEAYQCLHVLRYEDGYEIVYRETPMKIRAAVRDIELLIAMDDNTAIVMPMELNHGLGILFPSM